MTRVLFFVLFCVVQAVAAERFLLEEEEDVLEFEKDSALVLPGVFKENMRVIVGEGQELVIPADFNTETVFYANEAKEEYAMVMRDKKKRSGKHVVGSAMRGKRAFNIHADGMASLVKRLPEDELVGMDEELNPLKKKRPVQVGEVKTAQLNEGNVVKFNPGCWQGDAVPRELVIGIVADLSYSRYFGENVDAVLAEIQKIVTNSRLIMYVQLNVVLTVGEVVIGTRDSPSPLNETSVQMVRSSTTLLDPFRQYINQRQRNIAMRKASWHMLTNRWPSPGTVGMAYLGTLCTYEYNTGVTSHLGERTWYIWIHELGHSMGAFHSFENGIGRTGGIMDYGNYTYNGVVQFHPLKRAEMCPEFQQALICPYFREAAFQSKCGDGTLSQSEQCECLDRSQSCKGCVNCKTTGENVECSAEEFVFRQVGQNYTLSVDSSSLANPTCCNKNKRFVPIAEGKCDGEGGYCEFGSCQNRCKKFAIPLCDVEPGRSCIVPCLFNGDCRADLRTSSGVYISLVPDGVRCEGGGVCQSGRCSTSTLQPTSPPVPPNSETKSPTRGPTHRRRRRRTLFPTRTRSPTVETSSPTTRSPTKSPTKRPTRSPTEAPVECCACPTESPAVWNGTYEYY